MKGDARHLHEFRGVMQSFLSSLQSIHAIQSAHTPNIVENVIHGYRDDAPRLIAAMQSAMESNDSESLRIAAHALKSSSASLGAHGLSQLCLRLELLAREQRAREGLSVLAELRTEFARVLAALDSAAGEMGQVQAGQRNV